MSIKALNCQKLRSDLPSFNPGDEVVVRSKIKEGDKERIQAFEGIVIARRGSGMSAVFTVRKNSFGVGVERTFTLQSPTLVGIDRKKEGFVRRSKLYYLRGLEGKSARIQDKNLKLMQAQGVEASHVKK
jgi:large subunit ribosomal protein L19